MSWPKGTKVDGWRGARILLAAFSLCLAGVAVATQLGDLPQFCSAGCRDIKQVWYSPALTAALFLGSIIALVSQFAGSDMRRRQVAWGLGCCALVAAVLMASVGHSCAFCLAAQSVWATLALEAVGRVWVRVGAIALSVIGLEAAYETWQLNGPPAEKTVFERRSYEHFSQPKNLAFVIFTDPCCSFCRRDERQMASSPPNINVIHRWKLLPQHGEEAVRLAAAIESATASDASRGAVLFEAVYRTPDPPKKAEFVKMGLAAGFEAHQLEAWLDAPEPRSLERILNDGKLADGLHISQVPALCVVEAPPNFNSHLAIRRLNRKELNSYETMLGTDLSSLRNYVQ